MVSRGHMKAIACQSIQLTLYSFPLKKLTFDRGVQHFLEKQKRNLHEVLRSAEKTIKYFLLVPQRGFLEKNLSTSISIETI